MVGGILRGDFGYSRSASQPVIDLLKRRFPATVELASIHDLPHHRHWRLPGDRRGGEP